MKTMKKLVAALLVLTMVLALTGSAFAACIKPETFVKFTKNSYAYKETSHGMKKITDPEVIVRKGSRAFVWAVKGNYAFVQLTPAYVEDDRLGNSFYLNDEDEKCWFWGYWFKLSTLALIVNPDHYVIDVTFSNGGNGKSLAVAEDGKIIVYKDKGEWMAEADEEDWMEREIRLSPDCMKHLKATAKVWMHKTPSLSQSYGKALHKDDKVGYRRVWGFDTRGTIFLGIKYKGKCLWVSSKYTKFVK